MKAQSYIHDWLISDWKLNRTDSTFLLNQIQKEFTSLIFSKLDSEFSFFSFYNRLKILNVSEIS